VFALVVFLSDDFLVIKKKSTNADEGMDDPNSEVNKLRRFFRITQVLPIELQMMVCNRLFGSARDLIRTVHSEVAFKRMAQRISWE